MAYNAKTDWKHDDNITENDVNRWEQGIADAHEKAEEIEEDIDNLQQEFTAHQADDANPHKVTSEQVNVIDPLRPEELIESYPLGLSVFHTTRNYRDEWNDVFYNIYNPKHSGRHYRAIVETYKYNNISGKQRVSFVRTTSGHVDQGEVEAIFERGAQGNPNGEWGYWKRILTEEELNEHKADDMKHIPEDGQIRKIVKAYPNTSYTIPQVRNIIISPSDADINSMDNGDIWIKYK